MSGEFGSHHPPPTTHHAVFTVPNFVSALRLLAVPYFWYILVVQDQVEFAALLIFLIGATDWVDGFLARKLNQVSELGKFLDPLADRLMIASALVGGLVAGVLPAVIGWPLIIREVLVGLGTLVMAMRGAGTLEVRFLGKAATFLLYGAIPSFYLINAGVATWLFGPPAWIAGVVGLLLYWFVGAQYVSDIVKLIGSVKSPGNQKEG